METIFNNFNVMCFLIDPRGICLRVNETVIGIVKPGSVLLIMSGDKHISAKGFECGRKKIHNK